MKAAALKDSTLLGQFEELHPMPEAQKLVAPHISHEEMLSLEPLQESVPTNSKLMKEYSSRFKSL